MIPFYSRPARFVLPYSLLILLLLASLPSLAQTIRYVKPVATGTGDGSSWANASGDLQAMISNGLVGGTRVQVWVMAGTYKPGGNNNTDRTKSFSMRDNVAIYGGFVGNETKLTDRNLPSSSSTTLSGEIGGPGNADNSYHVIKNPPGLTKNAILDGFVIAGGNANSDGDEQYGGGIYNDGRSGKTCSPTIRNCFFVNNQAILGGAMMNDGYQGNSSPILENCTFQRNSAVQSGGAIFNSGGSGDSSPTLTSCSFRSNSAQNRGGAMYNGGPSGTSNPNLINCSFQGNKANFEGGALFNSGWPSGTCRPLVTNCSFQSNSAPNGGAMTNDAGASRDGGTSIPTLVNCVFFNNGAANTIQLRDNSYNAQATYSLFDESVTGYEPGNIGNATTATSPFADPDGTQLACGSPAVNAGNKDAAGLKDITTDLAGNPRIDGGRVDMGAYELQGDKLPKWLYVSASGTNTNPATATSWATATNDLQGAINSLCSSFTAVIWVAEGLYKPTTDNDRNVSFSMINNVTIYGGFAGTETTLADRKLTFPSSTTLSGDIGKANDISDNSYHVFSNSNLTNTAILDGFVITAGNASGRLSTNGNGGGMYNIGRGIGQVCSPTIRNCYFLNNQASLTAGAMFNDGANRGTSSPVLTNCSFQANSASSGGAMYNNGAVGTSSPQLTNCSFQDNSATLAGGAMCNSTVDGDSRNTSRPTLMNCVFFNNGGGKTFASGPVNSGITASYSLFDDKVTGYTGPNNLTVTAGNSPFLSPTDTQLACKSPAIDAGDPATTSALVGTTDLAGNPRNYNAIDMGAFEQKVVKGEIEYRGLPVIPSPQEIKDTITSKTDAFSTFKPATLFWQKNEIKGAPDNGWEKLTGSDGKQFIALPKLSIDGPYYFRRVTDCVVSDRVSVEAKVSNGRIAGTVASDDGTGVSGIIITIVRTTTGLVGGSNTKTYSTTTGIDGTYGINEIYYGLTSDLASDAIKQSKFIITPSYTDPSSATLVHVFKPASLTVDLASATNEKYNQNFTDQTTLSISGKAIQTCTGCLATTGNTLGECPVDGVIIQIGRSNIISIPVSTTTGVLGTAGFFSRTVSGPGSYSITATKGNLVFTLSPRTLPVQSNVPNVSFTSATTQTIVGRVGAGCNEFLGEATLEFTDVPKPGQTPCFRKQAITKGGSYTIALPSRQYRVTVLSLTPTKDVTSETFTNYFDKLYQSSPDSLIRDLTSTTAVTTLNLTYQRPPNLRISGLSSPPGCTTATFPVVRQGVPIVLKVEAFQGAKPTNGAPGCPVGNGTATITTNLERGSTTIPLSVTLINGVGSLTLTPGLPNETFPFTRPLSVNYTNPGTVSAPVESLSVVVTGVVSRGKTFQTVSPEIPLLVLHHPPGDGSFSFQESNKTHETAVRISAADGRSDDKWGVVKAGFAFSKGAIISVESAVWGTLEGNITTSSGRGRDDETIVSVTTGNRLETSGASGLSGGDADVFYGLAFNMSYAKATVIAFDPESCTVGSTVRMIIDEMKPQTTYTYTAYAIKTTTIPGLERLRDADSTKASYYDSQISVWRQVLANNEENKRKASFVTNKSFSGGGQPDTQYTTESRSAANTIEFTMNIDTATAYSIGLEIAGTGFNGGASCTFKMESGTATTTTDASAVTTGYTLVDKNLGDAFTVNIKKDPVYGTPVFDLLAGQSSCPAEDNTVPRDIVELRTDAATQRGVPTGKAAVFKVYVKNLSALNEARTYRISLVPDSNPDGANVVIRGSDGILSQEITVDALKENYVTIFVTQPPGNGLNPDQDVYAFENLKFKVEDACGTNLTGGGTVLETIDLSVYFQSPCSGIALTDIESERIKSSASNSQLPVSISGYTLANLSKVAFQYRQQGAGWETVEELSNAQLSPTGTTSYTWAIPNTLKDGQYELRLKLTCPQGVVYSQSIDSRIKRTPPVPVGTPQPSNDVYLTGSTIGITYSEPVDCSLITASSVIAKGKNGRIIPVSVGCNGNQVVIIPTGSLTPGEIVSLTLTGITDLYGNKRTTPDVWSFRVGGTTAATGISALSVAVANSPLSESATGTMKFIFSRSDQAKSTEWLVNFALTGTAQVNNDYTLSYANSTTALQPLVLTGTLGSIRIPTGVTSVTLLVDPIDDAIVEPDETVIISLLDGGDYQISAASSASAVIRNDDLPPTPNSLTLVSSASPTTLCAGGSVALSATATGGSSYSYTWAAPAGITLSGTSTSAVTASGITAGVRTFTVTATGASTATSGSKPSITSTVSVTVSALPTPTLTVGPSATLTCTQSNLTLTAGGGTVGAPFTYRFAGPGIASQNAATGTATVNASGTYSVTVTNAGGCIATTTLIVSENSSSQRTQIAVQPASTSVVNAGVSVSVSVSAIGTNLTYQWSKDGTALAGATASVLSLMGVTTTQSGTYVCTVLGACGSATSQPFALTVNAAPIVLATIEPNPPFQIELFPNPATSDKVWVKIQGAIQQPVHLQLLDMKGRVVWEHHVKVTTREHIEPLEIGNFPAGLLLLRVSTSDQTQVKKILRP